MSGSGESPCPSAGPTTEQLVLYSRMLRPFPVKKLGTILYHVLAVANSIERAMHALEADPPQIADNWCFEVQQLEDALWSLTEYAVDAQAALHQMYDSADADERRAMTAMVAIMRGLKDEPGPFRDPEPCPRCAGHGGSSSDGDCGYCSGTGVDPGDPASPL